MPKSLDKPTILVGVVEGLGDAVYEGCGTQRAVEEGVNIARLIGSRKEVINPPKVNASLASGEVLIRVVRPCNGVQVAVGKLHRWQLFLLCRG